MQRYRRFLDEPNMSDKTLLMNVEDLINLAFGTAEQNMVNFKMIQTVLHIIARQMRLLEQDVEIKFDELGVTGARAPGARGGQRGQDTTQMEEDYIEEEISPISSSTSEDRAERGEERGGRGGVRDDRGGGRDDRGGGRDDRGGGRDDRGGGRDDRGGGRDDRGGGRDDRGGGRDDRGGGRDDRGGGRDDRGGGRDDRGGGRDDRGGGRDDRGGGRDDRGGGRDDRGGGREDRGGGRDDRGGGRDDRGGGRDDRGGGRDDRGGGRDDRGGGRDDRGGGKSKPGDKATSKGKGGAKGSPEGRGGGKGSPEGRRISSPEGGGSKGSPEGRGGKEGAEGKRGEKGGAGGRGYDKGDDKGRKSGKRGEDRSGDRDGRGGQGGGRDHSGDRDGGGGQGGGQDRIGGRDGGGGQGGGRDRSGDRDGGGGQGGGQARSGGRDGGGGQGGGRDRSGGRDGGGGQGWGEDEDYDQYEDGGVGRGGGTGGRSGRTADRGRKGTPESSRSETASQARSVGKEGSRTSITVSEAERKGGKGAQDKILVVERTAAGSKPGERHVARVGSIEVVTASQFALLQQAVQKLQTITGPVPIPALPDNEKLRKDLAKGTATLPDTMQAMQLNARVQAAENCLTRMASLLTELAAAGALPQDMASRIDDVRAELQQVGTEIGMAGGGALESTGIVSKDRPGTGGAILLGPDLTIKDESGKTVPGGGAGTGSQARPGSGGAISSATSPSQRPSLTGLPLSGRKPVAIDATSTMMSVSSRPESTRRGGDATSGGTSRPSLLPGVSASAAAVGPGALVGVTHSEMEDVLQNMKDDLLRDIMGMTNKAFNMSEVASNMAKSVEAKFDVALKLDKRITKLFSQTADYSEQLSGFDSGLTSQMTSFQEQMAQIRNDLKSGLEQFEQANNNAETAAIQELTERYEGLVVELDNTLHMHTTLTILQKQLGDELRSLVECVEMLREQKADRDEVFDGLRDKADLSRLAGLLQEEEFREARVDLERRLDQCYDKFNKQDRVWLGALKDLDDIVNVKAEYLQLLNLKSSTEEELRNVQNKLRTLFVMLGEPKAAILTRMLAKGAVCGSCLVPALMEPVDLHAGKPPALPRARPRPLGEEAPCVPELQLPHPPDERTHVCKRWTGGSHTLVASNVARERALPPQVPTSPTKKYTGYGIDGKLYMLEEDLLPCLECNKMSTDGPLTSNPLPTPTGGGGDQAPGEAPPGEATPAETEEGRKEKEKKIDSDGVDGMSILY